MPTLMVQVCQVAWTCVRDLAKEHSSIIRCFTSATRVAVNNAHPSVASALMKFLVAAWWERHLRCRSVLPTQDEAIEDVSEMLQYKFGNAVQRRQALSSRLEVALRSRDLCAAPSSKFVLDR